MDVVLGVAVADRVARLALVGSGAGGGDVIDQSFIDLDDNPIEQLTQTVVGTNRLLADENHRLVSTRLCWSDVPSTDTLRRLLENSGVQNVVVLDEQEASTALMHAVGPQGSAVPEDHTVALARGAAMSAVPATMAQPRAYGADATMMSPQVYDADATAMSPQAYGADATAMLGSQAPHDPDATAMLGSQAPHGADATAMFGPQAPYGADATTITPTSGMAGTGAEEQQLAYSMADDHELLPVEMDEYGDEYVDEYVDDEADAGPAKLSRGSLLIGNAVVAFAVIGLASLAVAVTVAVRPTSASQPVVGHQNAAPGKFMPLLPTQQQAPVPPPPADSPNIGYQGGIIPDTNGYIPPQLVAPSGGGGPVAPVAPAPASPAPVPGFVPDPRMPIPVPIFIPFPGWRPPPIFIPPPFRPPTPSGTTSVNPGASTPSTPSTPTKQPLVPSSTPPTPSTPSTKPLVPLTPSSVPSTPSGTPSAPSGTPSAATTTPPASTQPPSTSQAPQVTSAPPTSKQTSVAPAPSTVQPTVAPTKPLVPQTQAPTVAPTKPLVPQTQAPTVAPPKPQVPQTQQPKPLFPKPPGGGF